MSGAKLPFSLYELYHIHRDNFVFLKFCLKKSIVAGVKISVPGQSDIISVIEYSLS